MGNSKMSDSEQERRMEVERFVCHENVARFRHLLTTDPNERERKMLFSLLAEEKEKQMQLEEPIETGRRLGWPFGETA
jgi:hypothetical protein